MSNLYRASIPGARLVGSRPAFLAPLTLPATVVVIGHREDTANGGQVCTFEAEVETRELESYMESVSEEFRTHNGCKLPSDWRVRIARGDEVDCDAGVVISSGVSQ